VDYRDEWRGLANMRMEPTLLGPLSRACGRASFATLGLDPERRAPGPGTVARRRISE
jgi:hypothetical protein